MTDDELREYSKKIKTQADRILTSTNLVRTLEAFGDVFINGSYPLDIMYDPDLDVIVAADDIRASSQNSIKKLIEQENFKRYEYGDFVKFPREKRPQGYIVALKTTVENVEWEVEIWFLPSFEKERNYLLWIKERLNKTTRMKILKAKHERNKSGKTKHDLSSFEIYKQVLGAEL